MIQKCWSCGMNAWPTILLFFLLVQVRISILESNEQPDRRSEVHLHFSIPSNDSGKEVESINRSFQPRKQENRALYKAEQELIENSPKSNQGRGTNNSFWDQSSTTWTPGPPTWPTGPTSWPSDPPTRPPGPPTWPPGPPTLTPGPPSWPTGPPTLTPGTPFWPTGPPTLTPGTPSWPTGPPTWTPGPPTWTPGPPTWTPGPEQNNGPVHCTCAEVDGP